jgi:hypothetical protein
MECNCDGVKEAMKQGVRDLHAAEAPACVIEDYIIDMQYIRCRFCDSKLTMDVDMGIKDTNEPKRRPQTALFTCPVCGIEGKSYVFTEEREEITTKPS